jgi:protein-S-isoprenylcysteine O-methyltransferase Ste14
VSSRLRLDAFVPALFAAAAVVTAARAVTVIGHALEHPSARAWLVIGCDLLRTGIAVAFALLTIGRAVPRRPAREPIAFLACAVAMGAAVASHDPSAPTPNALVITGEFTAVIGFAWMMLSVTFLGRCFGVLPEARGLVTRGPYGVVRHPVYLGEIAACCGLTIAAPTIVNAVVLGVFAVAQAIRMRLEERALRDAFPDEYGSYARSVPRIIPVAGRRLSPQAEVAGVA